MPPRPLRLLAALAGWAAPLLAVAASLAACGEGSASRSDTDLRGGRTAPAAEESASEDATEFVAAALQAFSSERGKRWPPPEQAVLQVHQAIGRGDLDAARSLSATLFQQEPDRAEAAFTRGLVLYLSASFGKARPLFEQVLRAGPSFTGSERVFFLYGVCLMRLGEGAAARAALDAQLELLPEDGDTLAALGELTLQEGDAEGAIALLRRARAALEAEQAQGIPNGPSLAKVHASFGGAYLQQGKLKQALRSLESSVALDPNQPQPWYALSRVHLRLGDAVSARRAVDRFRSLSAGS